MALVYEDESVVAETSNPFLAFQRRRFPAKTAEMPRPLVERGLSGSTVPVRGGAELQAAGILPVVEGSPAAGATLPGLPGTRGGVRELTLEPASDAQTRAEEFQTAQSFQAPKEREEPPIAKRPQASGDDVGFAQRKAFVESGQYWAARRKELAAAELRERQAQERLRRLNAEAASLDMSGNPVDELRIRHEANRRDRQRVERELAEASRGRAASVLAAKEAQSAFEVARKRLLAARAASRSPDPIVKAEYAALSDRVSEGNFAAAIEDAFHPLRKHLRFSEKGIGIDLAGKADFSGAEQFEAPPMPMVFGSNHAEEMEFQRERSEEEQRRSAIARIDERARLLKAMAEGIGERRGVMVRVGPLQQFIEKPREPRMALDSEEEAQVKRISEELNRLRNLKDAIQNGRYVEKDNALEAMRDTAGAVALHTLAGGLDLLPGSEDGRTAHDPRNQKALDAVNRREAVLLAKLRRSLYPEREQDIGELKALRMQRRRYTTVPRGQTVAGGLAEMGDELYGRAATAEGLAGGVARGAAQFAMLIAPGAALGKFAMLAGATQAGLQSGSEAATAKERELRAAGITDEARIAQEADTAGLAAMARTAPAMLLYWGTGKLAGGVAAKLAGRDASAFAQAGASFAGGEVANVGTGTVIRMLSGEDWKPTMESLTVDTLFAVMHGRGDYRRASHEIRARVRRELLERGFKEAQLQAEGAYRTGADERYTLNSQAEYSGDVPAQMVLLPQGAVRPFRFEVKQGEMPVFSRELGIPYGQELENESYRAPAAVQKAVMDEVRKAEDDFRYFGATPRILNAAEIINEGKPNSFLSMGLDGNLNVVPERFPRDFSIPLIRIGLREELIHAVWVAMLRAKGNRSGGREVDMESLAKDYTQEVFDQLASTPAGRQLIQDSMNLYFGNEWSAQPWPDLPYPDQGGAVNIGNRSDVTPSLIAEMTRQLVQTRLYDHQTEIVLARAFGSFEEWLKDIAERLRTAAGHPDRVSPLLSDAILYIEGQLKSLEELREKRWGKKWDAFERTRVPR